MTTKPEQTTPPEAKQPNRTTKVCPSKRIKKAWRADCAANGMAPLRAFARYHASFPNPLDAIATAWLDSKAKR